MLIMYVCNRVSVPCPIVLKIVRVYKMTGKHILLVLFFSTLCFGCINKKAAENENVLAIDDIEENEIIHEQTVYDIPVEFIGKNWNSNFGNLSPVENITLNDLQSCSWQRNDTILIFSREDHYAGMSRSSYDYGRYILENNTIHFSPPLNIVRFSEEYSIASLHYSNEMYYEGTPALTNDDETIIFTANDSKKAIVGEVVKIHQHYCEKIWEGGRIITNGVLFSLPDITSKNIFQGDYYGEKATEAAIVKLAKTTINNIVWYYILFDFSSREPSDGGGPFYNGWLPEEYFE